MGKPSLSADDLKLIQVGDFGDRYVIKVKGRVREYFDDSRDCAKRARVAAVFVALTLAPPDIGIGDEPGPAPTPPPNAEPPVRPITAGPAPPATSTRLVTVGRETRGREPRGWGIGAELGARADAAPRADQSAFDAGGHFQLVYASRDWGVVLGGYVPTASTLQLDNVHVQQTRYAAFAGLRRVGHKYDVRWNLDVCASAAVLRLRQLDAVNTNTVWRPEPALHLGLSASHDEHLISPFAGLFVELVPVTIPIAVEPRGVVGHSSAVWIGLVAGLALGSY